MKHLCLTHSILIVLLFLASAVYSISFNVDSSNPLPLTNTLKSINLVTTDSSGLLWIIYSDYSISKFASNLSSSTTISNYMNLTAKSLNFYSTDLIYWKTSYKIGNTTYTNQSNITSSIAVIISTSNRRLFLCNTQTLSLVGDLNFTADIVANRVIPFNFTPKGQRFIHTVLTSAGIWLNFEGTQYSIATFGSVSIDYGLIMKQIWLSTNTTNIMLIKNRVYAALSNESVVQIQFNINVTYYSSNNTFSLSTYSKNTIYVYRHYDGITGIFVYGNCILTQDYYDNIYGYDYLLQKKVNAYSQLQYNRLHEIVVISNKTYFSYSSKYIQIYYNSTSNYISYVTQINTTCSSSSRCSFYTIIGTSVSIAYRKGMGYLYKLSPCTGQKVYFNSTCTSYSCSVANCKDCSISSNICSYCNNYHARSDNLATCTTTLCNITNCGNCINNTCFFCQDGFDLINNACVVFCNISHCISCNYSNACTVCQDNYQVVDNSCVAVATTVVANSSNNSTNNNYTNNYTSSNLTDNSTVNSTDNSTVNSTDNSTVNSTDNSTVNSTDNSTINQNSTYNSTNGTAIEPTNSTNSSSPSTNNSTISPTSNTPTTTNSAILSLISCSFLPQGPSKQSCLTYLNNDVSKYSMMANQVIMSTPAVSQILSWLSPLFTFNNDYWYYIYHNRTYQNLLVTNIFFEIISQINNQRMIPFFVNEANAIEGGFVAGLYDYFTENMTDYSNYRVLLLNQESTQFVINIHAMILWNYGFAIMLMIVFRIGFKMTNKIAEMLKPSKILKKSMTKVQLKQNASIFLTLSKICLQNSTFSFILVSLIESNCIFICFYAGLQLKIPFQFQFADKINTLISVIFLFLCLIFSLVFYRLLWAFRVKFTRNLIDDKKISYGSYSLNSSIVFIKSVLYGLFQSIFITEYKTLICLLILLKMCLLSISINNRHHYKFRIFGWLNISYFLFSILYDCFLFTSYCLQNIDNYMSSFLIENGVLFQFVFLGGVIFSVFLLILSTCFKSVYNCCHKKDESVQQIYDETIIPKHLVGIVQKRTVKYFMSIKDILQPCDSKSPAEIHLRTIEYQMTNIFNSENKTIQTSTKTKNNKRAVNDDVSDSSVDSPIVKLVFDGKSFRPKFLFDGKSTKKNASSPSVEITSPQKKVSIPLRAKDVVQPTSTLLRVTKTKSLANFKKLKITLKQGFE